MRLSKLVKAIEGCRVFYPNGDWEREIISLSVDSRKEEKSSLFFCLSGGQIDSHAYAKEGIEKGAVAIVAERELDVDVPQLIVKDSRLALALLASAFYGNPSQGITVIGITGTNGKTTISYMLEGIFRANGKRTGVIGTLGVRYGEVEKPCDLTTPDPIFLQKILAEMRLAGVEVVIMEVSAHALYYKKTAGVRFSACIFTNLSQDHLDFFQTMSAYEESKLTLFDGETCPIAIVNGDEETGRKIGEMRQITGSKTLFYGLNTPADGFAVITDEGLTKTECMLNINDELCRVTLSMTGRHNVYNALAAASCGVELKVSPSQIAKGLTEVKGVKGRLQWVATSRGGHIYVDFAHTPDGIEKSLAALKVHCRGRLLCLFGCGGNRDKGKRSIMGEYAAKGCDFAVLTSDNPRFEDPLDIISEIERGYRRYSSRYVIVPDRERAIEYALAFLREGDILLIAGKGGEEYQEVMGIKYPFNDQAIVEKILQKKGSRL